MTAAAGNHCGDRGGRETKVEQPERHGRLGRLSPHLGDAVLYRARQVQRACRRPWPWGLGRWTKATFEGDGVRDVRRSPAALVPVLALILVY